MLGLAYLIALRMQIK